MNALLSVAATNCEFGLVSS